MSIYKKEIEAPLDISLNVLREEIPQLKSISEYLSLPALRYQTMDTGDDYKTIYK